MLAARRPGKLPEGFYAAAEMNRRVVLHAIDATFARWRGGVGLSPLDGAQQGRVIAEK